jgi:4-amino-4-deoxy-L-arabinose transferase-like glycosyltransferase
MNLLQNHSNPVFSLAWPGWTKNRLSQAALNRIFAYLIILIFWVNGVTHLDVWPLVHEDEAWIISPGYTFWGEGRFGSDLFTGFYGMENHFFGFLPLFSLLNGGLARLIGLGLFQTRFGALLLMVLALALTYRVGRLLFSAPAGLLAVLFLTFLRIAAPFYHLKLGIPFADAARIARYDMAVPIFALSGWLCFIKGLRYDDTKHPKPQRLRNPQNLLFFLSGVLIGLASLNHIYGAFWLPALGLTHFWLVGKKALKPALLMVLGFGLPWLPYLVYVVSAWADFLGQNLANQYRVEVTSPAFYLANLWQEGKRYNPVLAGVRLHFGSWFFLLGLPLAVGSLFYRAVRFRDQPAKLILGPLLGLLFSFAFFIATKTFTYLATLWPILAIGLAVAFVGFWQAKAGPGWRRPVLMILLVLVVLEGSWGMLQFQRQAAQTTPYRVFTARLARHLPGDSQILALQHYWLGLTNFRYRTMLVPTFLVSARHTYTPISFYQALARCQSDVIIIDEIMQRYFDEIAPTYHRDHQILAGFQHYLADHQAQVLDRFQDPSYGRVTIYQLRNVAP